MRTTEHAWTTSLTLSVDDGSVEATFDLIVQADVTVGADGVDVSNVEASIKTAKGIQKLPQAMLDALLGDEGLEDWVLSAYRQDHKADRDSVREQQREEVNW